MVSPTVSLSLYHCLLGQISNCKLQSFISIADWGLISVHVCVGGYFWLYSAFHSGVYTLAMVLGCASRMNKQLYRSVCLLQGCILMKRVQKHALCIIYVPYVSVQRQNTKIFLPCMLLVSCSKQAILIKYASFLMFTKVRNSELFLYSL